MDRGLILGPAIDERAELPSNGGGGTGGWIGHGSPSGIELPQAEPAM